MTPLILSAAAAVLAFGAAMLFAGEGARAWRLAAGVLVALVAGGVASKAPSGIGSDLVAEARGADGLPVHTTAVLQRTGARRQIRQVPLQRPVPHSGSALVLMMVLGLAGAGLSVARKVPRSAALSGVLPLAGAAVAVLLVAGGGAGGSGPDDVRAWLLAQGAADLAVTGFTVPESAWVFVLPAARALGFAAVVAALGALSVVRPRTGRFGAAALAAGGLVALGALVWRVTIVGGLPWRAPELSLLGAAALLAAAWAVGAGRPEAAADAAPDERGGTPAWAPALLSAAAVAVLALGGA